MPFFTNVATLTYTGGTTVSNTVTGELVEVLSGEKNALLGTYTAEDTVTFIITLRNTGLVALNGLTVTDDLGGYAVGANTVYPLAYVAGSAQYYVNGVQQPAPVVNAGPPLTITGLNVPAGGNGILLYEAAVTGYAPLDPQATITNTATVTGYPGEPLVLQATITTLNRANLTINKALSPTVVAENGELTYTFLIRNTGNIPAVATDNLVLQDTFNPILNSITVTLDGITLVAGVDYTYNPATGVFATTAGRITVPAATYAQQPDGTYIVTPGTAVVTVTGTV